MTTTMPVSPRAPQAAPPVATKRTFIPRLFLGKPEDPRWVRPSSIALLLVTAVLYLWGLGESGWANAFYSAAAQAGSESWKAFFYGSSDAANAITVDKTPASLWVMTLSVRIFGLSSWSILVPQALMGVATTGLLFASVRRWYGPVAGLIAGAVSALTPAAVLMFRFNNPDALLTLLMVAAAWAITRACEDGRTKWLVWAGVFVGFGFLTKMLQVLLVVPAFGLAYLLFGPPRIGRRIVQLLLAGLAIVVCAGWWIAIVELVPASMRPYIGGSQNNSILELTLGYNGVGRLNGDETGRVGGFGSGKDEAGWLRMFDASQGGQISWLLPAALILLAAGLVLTARTDRLRCGLVLWGGWLVITGLVFSLMQGIFHEYYTVALAPAVGAVVGIGAALTWRAIRNRISVSPAATAGGVPAGASPAGVIDTHPTAHCATDGDAVTAADSAAPSRPAPSAPSRSAPSWHAPFGTVMLALAIGVSAWWSYTLLGRSADFLPWLRWMVLIGGQAAAVGALGLLRLPMRMAPLVAGVALGATLAGSAAYAVQTASEPHTGSIPTAGPGVLGGFPGGTPGGGFPGANGGQQGNPEQGGGPGGLDGPDGPGGGMSGLLDAPTVSDRMKALLDQNASSYTWVAATVGSQNASGYQLATGDPVMAIGGFNGTDPSPTLKMFQQYVADRKIHYFIGGDDLGGGRAGDSTGGSDYSSQISQWVSASFTAQTADDVTVYDLTQQQ